MRECVCLPAFLCISLALGASVGAQTPTTVPTTGPAADRKPLMEGLDAIGLAKPLERWGIAVYGFVEGGWTYNFDRPKNERNFGRVFDFEDNKAILDQLDLTVERTIDPSRHKWDVGFRMEWIYGADAGLIHSNGLFDWYDGPRDPENQFDLNQAYIDLAIPVGNGLLIRAGKTVTPLGQETINPTGNSLYSHSYLFGYAIPFTHTGVMAMYSITDNWNIAAGVFRGWEQSVDDNNDGVSWHLKLNYVSTDKKLNLTGQFVTGPERDDNDSDYRTVFDFIASYALTDRFTLTANADIGWEQGAAPDGGDAWWYGVAGYASYRLNSYLSLNGRAEWFRDEEGARIGVAGNYYEITLGVGIKPFPKDRFGQNLLIRPEIRTDFSDQRVFNDGEDQTQVTFGVDVVYVF